ncbi:MAG: tyrosine recombinase [Planctomycetota bacterium]
MRSPKLRDRAEITVFTDLRAAERGWSRHTCEAYLRDLNLYADFLSARQIERFSLSRAPLIFDFLAAREAAGDSERTLNRRLAALRSFHRHLLEEGAMKEDILVHLPAPKRLKTLPHYLTKKEMAALLDAAGQVDRPTASRDIALIELLYATGIRVSELCGLKELDLRPPEAQGLAQILVLGKGSKERWVPLHALAWEALQRYLGGGRSDLAKPNSPAAIWLNRRGKALSRHAVYRILRELGLVAQIRQTVTPHLLRHTFATHLVHEGADLRAVQELLGHANLETTTIYTSVDADRLRDIHRRHHPRG